MINPSLLSSTGFPITFSVNSPPQYNFHPALIRIPLDGPGYLAADVRNYVESSLNSLHLTAQTLVKIGTGATNCYVEYVDIRIHFNSF